MKLLVTGGSGFVGRTLCAQAEAEGWNVTTLSRTPAPHGKWLPIDLTRPFDVEDRFDVVVHAAARSSPWGKRTEYEAQNVEGTRNVLDFCERIGRPHVVYVSTSAVLYQNRHQHQMNESEPVPQSFLNEYARTKRLGETLVEAYAGTATIVRPRAVFGEGDTVVFPRLLRAAREGRFPILECEEPVMADLIHVNSLCSYILRAAANRAPGLFHLSNNQPVEIVPFLIDLFQKLALPTPTRRVPVKRAMRAAAIIEGVYRFLPFLGEPPITRFGVSVFAYSKTLDVTKALRVLGPPSVSLDEGVTRFVEWQRRQP